MMCKKSSAGELFEGTNALFRSELDRSPLRPRLDPLLHEQVPDVRALRDVGTHNRLALVVDALPQLLQRQLRARPVQMRSPCVRWGESQQNPSRRTK